MDATQDPIQGYLDRSRLSAANPRVVPLTPDASDRRYFRILLPETPSIVLSLYAAPFDVRTLPFVNVATLMARMPVPIPAVLGHADDLGVLALQDLGDVTLQAHLGAASPAQHAALYRQSVALIATLQRRGQELASPEYLPYGIAFDVEKLTWELDFFTKHFLEAYRGITLADDERVALRAEFAGIVEELAAEPRVLCHRDYHSRNLMLHEGQLYMIDFQDARMGPDTYDLVSLLRDSYVDLPDQTVDELIAYFLALKGTPDDPDFRRRFNVMALQRNLKALGTFGYQTTARRNPVYIQYIPRTLRYVRRNLALPRFARLRDLLATHVEEFR
jgi:N-acetylmuramate 1-kinase